MTNWHGYFVVERGNIGVENWQALQSFFESMGTHGSKFPMHNNHSRLRLDSDAIIHESLFDPTEVSIESFKQALADEFDIDVNDIDHTVNQNDYAGRGTVTWEFLYNSVIRFTVRRFGGGGVWEYSRQECLGYIASDIESWESSD